MSYLYITATVLRGQRPPSLVTKEAFYLHITVSTAPQQVVQTAKIVFPGPYLLIFSAFWKNQQDSGGYFGFSGLCLEKRVWNTMSEQFLYFHIMF